MQQRSPVTIVLLGFVTCGIYHLIWMHQVGEEMRARGAEVPPTWHIIIPILNFLWMWKWAQAAEKVTNGALSAGLVFVLLWFLGPMAAFLVQPKFNEVH
ncbi:MAG TPA: DUF4234 domain-containing protein [Polyangiaceae bacterium]|jgi:hypothetical protein|nr:MAG: hypothetical protein BWY17_01396 [Deltaproteobacteria bacterium ADurb.Bin207]HNS96364.1 DUF4234 domain-containing protein [Polyangiaceae bacterium]HNZ22920.1 DUF4234 domain-containing protein [Polyangiaceae bacterium]HOH00456.1 DUF4234 domain-containing protein [Polyangiaceae bacterium]HOT09653.1 DUF4234 domain-containing protein [Polyangiaceae bacterium]